MDPWSVIPEAEPRWDAWLSARVVFKVIPEAKQLAERSQFMQRIQGPRILPPARRRMARHQIVGVHPAGQPDGGQAVVAG